MEPAPEFCVFGAGTIGCYLGGRLLASGAAVSFIGRPKIRSEIEQFGLHLSDLRGAAIRVQPSAIRFDEDPRVAGSARVVLVTVKSAATPEAAEALAAVLRPDATVVSFQNGVSNADRLQAVLPAHVVLGGMVPFNVVSRGQGAFHQGSDGALMIASHPAVSQMQAAFATAGLPLESRADFRSVQWAKLLLNLNNTVNALSGVPLKEELAQRGYRWCLAAAQREALELLRISGTGVAQLTPVPARWMPAMLSLPDVVFRRVASRMLDIDPLARSSMWEDLEAGRTTEVDWINGEILRLAGALNRQAPVNERLTALIRAAENGGRRGWGASELRQECRRAQRV